MIKGGSTCERGTHDGAQAFLGLGGASDWRRPWHRSGLRRPAGGGRRTGSGHRSRPQRGPGGRRRHYPTVPVRISPWSSTLLTGCRSIRRLRRRLTSSEGSTEW